MSGTCAGRRKGVEKSAVDRFCWLVGWLVGGWVGLGWVGLGWVGLGWVGLGWVGLVGWLVGWLVAGLGWLVGFGWLIVWLLTGWSVGSVAVGPSKARRKQRPVGRWSGAENKVILAASTARK